MANPQYNKVKAEAAQAIARAKARQGEVNAKAQVLKAKQLMAKAAK
ncbi:MAG: hypothetical protein GJ680_15020 [Alteromonadaceae bacterium]|nr:hypothetical protein [Alteromonadaceae bacterium]